MNGQDATGGAGSGEGTPFAGLTPDLILDAVDSALAANGIESRTSGQVIALNSYENRVFQVGLEDSYGNPAPLIAKFYRPGRWSDAQIREEHEFLEELAGEEVPAVPALRFGGHTLREFGGFRFALFERRGGRTPELSDPDVRERIGRFLGRLHAVGARAPFATRPDLDIERFAREPSRFLLAGDWIPPEYRANYRDLVAQAIEATERAWALAGPARAQRVHGDCHPGNLLWSEAGAEPGPYFVDFDDTVMAPAIQDMWMLLSGSRDEMAQQLRDVLRGYAWFARFDERELWLIEPLRTLRLIHYAAWIARRWTDPAFPVAFPWFGGPRYWEARLQELREQIAAMQEPPLEL